MQGSVLLRHWAFGYIAEARIKFLPEVLYKSTYRVRRSTILYVLLHPTYNVASSLQRVSYQSSGPEGGLKPAS